MGLILLSERSAVRAEASTLPALATMIEDNQITGLTIRGDLITAETFDGKLLSARKESSVSAFESFQLLGVSSETLKSIPSVVEDSRGGPASYAGLIITMIPLILIGFFVVMAVRQVQRGGGGGMGMGGGFPGQVGRSNARMVSANAKENETTSERPQVTFDDVAGAEQAKFELQEVVEFLKEADKFLKLGARVPRGVLMAGPPGTGKTLMAKAVAGEAGVPFFHISGSEFVEMFVGVGAARVRDLFKKAKEQSPAVVFIDEIDAVGRRRGAGLGGGNDEREQTLNQILVAMDGFDTDTNVIVVAATNRPDILDPALLRPGRFDRKIVLDLPDVEAREAILDVHTRGKPLDDGISLSDLAKLTPGFAGADLENLANEAAILAARRNRTTIGELEFQDAIERIIAGPERKGNFLSKDERKVIAYHEAGHAVVMHHTEESDPVHKVSIISRGMALGYTMPLPENNRQLRSREAFVSEIVSLLGGRAAEEIVFKRITTGASNDLERATRLARAMVTRLGFSQNLGMRTFGEEQGNPFLGSLGETRDYSEEKAQAIDQEMDTIIHAAYRQAKDILTEQRSKLDALAEALLEEETINRPQFEQLMAS
ncbi:MAG: ATP-dependent zinc metalloprotease FtsH [Anaerolineae bacterium]|nr:ATP-dependent zinc metalloprotease FtsH [Anaerolineae bacterium]